MLMKLYLSKILTISFYFHCMQQIKWDITTFSNCGLSCRKNVNKMKMYWATTVAHTIGPILVLLFITIYWVVGGFIFYFPDSASNITFG